MHVWYNGYYSTLPKLKRGFDSRHVLMKTLDKLYNRLLKLGIEITCIGNYPWIYLDTVNGNRVTEKFMAQHGFTIAVLRDTSVELTDIKRLFQIIRKYK